MAVTIQFPSAKQWLSNIYEVLCLVSFCRASLVLLCENCCELFNLRWFQCRTIVVIIGIWLLGHCQEIRLKAVTEGSRGRGSSSKKFQIFRCQRFWAFRRSLTNCRSRTGGPAITHCPRPVTCPCFMVRRRSSLLAPSPWWPPLSSSFDHLLPS